MALADLSKHAESVERFISDLAEAFRQRRWVRILTIFGIASAFLLNPVSVEYGLNLLGQKKPEWYSYLYWMIVTALFFVGAFLAALLTTKQEELETTATATSIIKGLLPYTNTEKDVEWFARLQRGNSLKECMNFCAGEDSAFAILSGESGTGKTSFLQAALCPNLDRHGQRSVYVKITDNSPLDSICHTLNINSENSYSGDQQGLLELLKQAQKNDTRPMVLILDQFEQFFAHHKSKMSRKPFIQQIAEWYKGGHSVRVKILISIRGDFVNRMNEFQKEMKYALTQHTNLSLEKFEPQEASSVISVIAKEAKIKYDEDFVKELAKYELADREDGTISPVDIQILSWMIDGQKSSEERAFNRKAFQKLGGVEGLLERFLNSELNARETKARRQAAIEVMLALTDQNVRTSALSLKDLKEKLSGVIPDNSIEDAVAWLAKSEVRLITAVHEKNATRYELAHERIIPPLRRLVLKEKPDVGVAQRTLDRRTNEWIGNNRSRRYLLTFKEWRLINRHRTLLTLGSQKEELVSRSKKRFLRMGLSFATVLFLGFVWYIGYVGYEFYQSMPITQINNAQNRLVLLLGDSKDVKATQYATFLLSALDSDQDRELYQKLWQHIGKHNSSDQAMVLLSLADAYIKLSKADDALKSLDKAQQAAENIDSSHRAYVLLSSAENYSKLSKTDEVVKGLDKVQKAAGNLNPSDRAIVLALLAEAYSKLSMTDEALRALDQAEQATKLFEPIDWPLVFKSLAVAYGALPMTDKALKGLDEVQDVIVKFAPPDKADILTVLAYGYGKVSMMSEAVKGLDKVQQAAGTLNSHYQAITLASLAASYSKLSMTDEALKGLNKVHSVVGKLDRSDQVTVLVALANGYGELSRTDKALKGLDEVQQTAGNLNPSDQADILIALAEAYGKLSKIDEALKALNQVQQETKKLDSANQPLVLLSLADAYIKLSKADDALKILDKVPQATEKVGPSYRAIALTSLADTYIKLSKADDALTILYLARQAANEAALSEKYFLVWIKVATLYAKLGRWRQALVAAQSIGSDVYEIWALSKILIVWKDTIKGTKNIDTLEELFQNV